MLKSFTKAFFLLAVASADTISVNSPIVNSVFYVGDTVPICFQVYRRGMTYLDFVQLDILDISGNVVDSNLTSIFGLALNKQKLNIFQWIIPSTYQEGEYTIKLAGEAHYRDEVFSKSAQVQVKIETTAERPEAEVTEP
ncbi:hypothetical protein K7432_004689 [Basidiobolus ranarum]|uniref:Uncharacterized protein n=1 Tax=Basidiobolus ranarum TaxID=34480 RepID=A0ABR2WXQ3_9FUNG